MSDFATLREEMVRYQIQGRGVDDIAVLEAMKKIPRHLFTDESDQSSAYEDHPLPIGSGQTISQPFMVADMSARLNIKPTARILEIGTGCGYQTAVLAELASEVVTIEIVPQLAREAKERLLEMDYHNIYFHQGDGLEGLPKLAPYDGILIAAACPEIPWPLFLQLKIGGMMILPIGDFYQYLVEVTKVTETEYKQTTAYPVRFVPMTGLIQTM